MKFYKTLTLLLISYITYGQDTAVQKTSKLNLVGYVGIHNILTPNLHSKLANIGYEKPAQSFYGFGVGLKYGGQKTFAGIDLSIHMLGSEARNIANAFLLQAFLHHKIVDNGNLYIAPGIDVGLQTIRIDFKRNNPANNFDTLFLSSGNYVRLRNLAPVGGISAIIHFKKLDNKRSFILRGLAHIRVGYKYGLTGRQWRADGKTIDNSPTDRLNSYYLQLVAGF